MRSGNLEKLRPEARSRHAWRFRDSVKQAGDREQLHHKLFPEYLTIKDTTNLQCQRRIFKVQQAVQA